GGSRELRYRCKTGNAKPYGRGMVVVMRTGHKHKHPLEAGLEHINPIKAQLLKIFGPADGRGNPLVGTQYDPVVRQEIETERRAERSARPGARAHAPPHT